MMSLGEATKLNKAPWHPVDPSMPPSVEGKSAPDNTLRFPSSGEKEHPILPVNFSKEFKSGGKPPQPRAVASQGNEAGHWYNPMPNPFTYGLPNNGGNMLSMGGMYGGMGMMNPMMMGGMGRGGMGMMNPMMMGGMGMGGMMNMYPWLSGPTGNMYGGYEYENNNPNSPLPSYGYGEVVGPTHFQSPLSGNGSLPATAHARIYEENFVNANDFFVTGALSALAGLVTYMGIGFMKPKLGLGSRQGLISLGLSAGVAALAYVGTGEWARNLLRMSYNGLDVADNGHVDGSYTTQRSYRVELPHIL